MKVTFLTNITSYYQLQLAKSFVERLGEENFRIVFYREIDQSRTEMGWEDSYSENYIIRFWTPESQENAKSWIDTADVVIHGRFPIKYVRNRIKQGKLTFAYQERIWKKSFFHLSTLGRIPWLYKNYWSVNKPNYHLLAIGAYAAPDLKKVFCFKNRMWKYGYFVDASLKKSFRTNNPLKLLWCGKLIDWKQPEVAIQIANELKLANVDFTLTFVGDGPERIHLENQTKELMLSDYVCFKGWMKKNQIENEMQHADLFLMTSNRKEGWGVVVNEAINSGCCVIANIASGSATWLINHNKTGLLYSDDNLAKIVSEIIHLSKNKSLCHSIGLAAKTHLHDHWSTDIAADRLINLSTNLLEKKDASKLYSAGPCSTA